MIAIEARRKIELTLSKTKEVPFQEPHSIEH